MKKFMIYGEEYKENIIKGRVQTPESFVNPRFAKKHVYSILGFKGDLQNFEAETEKYSIVNKQGVLTVEDKECGMPYTHRLNPLEMVYTQEFANMQDVWTNLVRAQVPITEALVKLNFTSIASFDASFKALKEEVDKEAIKPSMQKWGHPNGVQYIYSTVTGVHAISITAQENCIQVELCIKGLYIPEEKVYMAFRNTRFRTQFAQMLLTGWEVN